MPTRFRVALPLAGLLLLATVGVALAPAPGPFAEFIKDIKQKISWLNKRVPAERVFVVTDKTLYTPGETIWLTAFVREATTLAPLADAGSSSVLVELLDPSGAPSATVRLPTDGKGYAKGDFQLTEAMPGGRYKLRAFTDRQAAFKTDSAVAIFEKLLTVQAISLPRVKLKLDFPRKAYGPGDEVLVVLTAFANDNKPLAGRKARFQARVADQAVAAEEFTVGADGTASIRFILPKNLTSPDGLLTVLIPHEGLTESIARAIPIVLNRIRLDLLPEGGDLVVGLPGRVAVRATNEFGEPADVSGEVLDDRGKRVTTFTSVHDGLAAFDLQPAAGRTYRVRLTQPVVVDSGLVVPAALPGGYGLHVEHQDNQPLSAVLTSTVKETVLLVGVQRGQVVLERTVSLRPGRLERVKLALDQLPAGVVQLTVFDSKKIARAERLVFVNADKHLKITIKTNKERFGPREKITLTVQATDERGLAVPGAVVAVRVVDDQNLAFADDKQSTLASWLLLEADVKSTVREPRWYFDPQQKDAALGRDLLLLTHGWRRFTWQRVQQETPLPVLHYQKDARRPRPMAMPDAAQRNRMMVERMAEMPQLDEMVLDAAPPPAPAGMAEREDREEVLAPQNAAPALGGIAAGAEGKEIAGNEGRAQRVIPRPAPMPPPQPDGFYRAREFVAPTYAKPLAAGEERTDFRSTLYWAPAVTLDRAGRATLTFYNADGITSYRATAEGIAADGTLGIADTQFFTQPPLVLAVKLPPHVVIGDTLGLPVVISNYSDEAITGPLTVAVPAGWRALGAKLPTNTTISPRGSQTLTSRYVITGPEGPAELKIAFGNENSPLRDAFRQTLAVLPEGYPVAQAFSGNEAKRTYTLDASTALPGTLRVALTAFPSVETDLLKGIAGILREPVGCFEQTSTTSYPNVLVLDYLRQQRDPSPETQASIARAEALLDKGYAKLTSFETPEKGYEWFGGAPAHEALTAYGLLQFSDMRRVRPTTVSTAMVDRTHRWLMGRRDGQGGFQKAARALDEFGRATDEITNAYIVYSLVEAGYRDVLAEVNVAVTKAMASGDPYQLALLSNVLLTLREEGRARPLLTALYAKQGADGAWTGAQHSVTRSTGIALKIETTALALLAALKDDRRPGQALQSGVRFLIGTRSGAGNFSSTQGTILALKALTAYSAFAQQTTEDGAVEVWLGSRQIGRATYKAGQRTEVKISDLEAALSAPGPHQVEVRYAAGVKAPLPYTLAVDWRTRQAPSDDKCAVRLTTALAQTGRARVGESIRLTATLVNQDPTRGQPLTMALLGLPAGLTPQPWQLKQLQERGIFDYYELKDGRLACYFRDLKPGETVSIMLDLKAEVPGRFAAPASVAYLYYTDELKWWVPGVVGVVKS